MTIKDTNILTVPGLKECTWQLEEAILASHARFGLGGRYPSMGGVYLWEWQQLPEPKCFERASTLAQLLSSDEKPKELVVSQCLGFFDGRQYNNRHQSQDGGKVGPEKFGLRARHTQLR